MFNNVLSSSGVVVPCGDECIVTCHMGSLIDTNQAMSWGLGSLMTPGLSKDIRCHV